MNAEYLQQLKRRRKDAKKRLVAEPSNAQLKEAYTQLKRQRSQALVDYSSSYRSGKVVTMLLSWY
jgi:hypothetical protein